MKRWHAFAIGWLIALSAFMAAGVRILYARPVPYPVAATCVLAFVGLAGVYLALSDVLEKRAEQSERDAHLALAGNIDTKQEGSKS
jgi:hypothetical protein